MMLARIYMSLMLSIKKDNEVAKNIFTLYELQQIKTAEENLRAYAQQHLWD